MGLNYWGGEGFATEGHNFMSRSWMNRALIVGGVAAGVGTAISTASDFMEDTWNQNPNAFEKAGHGIGEVATEAAMAVGTAAWALSQYRTTHSAKAIKTASGEIFRTLKGNSGHQSMKNGLVSKSVTGTEGIWAKGRMGFGAKKFMPSPKGFGGNALHMAKDAGKFMILPMIAGMVLGATLGFAGKYLDEVATDSRARKAMYYDNRYFDTRQYDASSHQQIGMAMNDYSNKMQSIARVYHAR